MRSSLFLPVFLLVGAYAQAQLGRIHGMAENPAGIPTPGTEIILHGANNGINRVTFATGDGSFEIASLKPGIYELAASRAGFANSR